MLSTQRLKATRKPAALAYSKGRLLSPRALRSRFLAAVVSTAVIFTASANDPVSSSLPELGDAASVYLNTREEERIGKQFFRQLLSSPDYISDPEIHYYLNQLGAKVGASANLGELKLHFNLLRQNDLNAFAVPGGYITFHSGLVLTTDSESELASVVGHEIAHLSQRHLPRMIAKAEASKLPTTAAIIAAILVGGQAGVAGVTLANANLLSNQLAYSREFEKEADAIGIQMMSSSGFDPQATSAFFEKLQRFTLVTSKDVPEFLRSHPLSYTRVAEAESRLAALPTQPHNSSLEYFLVRAKIRALYTERPAVARKELELRVKEKQGTEKWAAQYGLALSLIELRRFSEATDLLNQVQKQLPGSPAVVIALAQAELGAGNGEIAVEALRSLTEENKTLNYISLYYLDALLEQERFEEAKKVARYQLRRHPDDFRLYPRLSKANVGLDDLAEAHQADAEYLAAIGRYQTAVASLKLALRDNAEDSAYLKQSIQSRLTQLEALADAEKKGNKKS